MSGDGYVENECRECGFVFEDSVQLANHKANFCTDSKYFDPAKAQQLLTFEENPNKQAGNLSFNDIRSYLRQQGDLSGQGVGKMTLADIKGQLADNDSDFDILRQQLQEERDVERADQLRALNVKQQKARTRENANVKEITELHAELEARKEGELRARIERDRVQRQLKAMNHEQLHRTAGVKKRELKKIADEKETLAVKEEEMLRRQHSVNHYHTAAWCCKCEAVEHRNVKPRHTAYAHR